MHGFLARTLNAQRRATVKEALRKRAKDRVKRNDLRENRYKFRGEHFKRIIANRKEAVEDWKLGPLAPKRDYGEFKNTYGTLSERAMYPPRLDKEALNSEEEMRNVIRKNDRVVVIRGRLKGQIRVVDQTKEEQGTVDVQETINVWYPDHVVRRVNETENLQPHNLSIPMEDVRLVHRIVHPDGKEEDVIVDKMRCVWEKASKSGPGEDSDEISGWKLRRYIPGILPRLTSEEHGAIGQADLDALRDKGYPIVDVESDEDGRNEQLDQYEADTQRLTTEHVTWKLDLDAPPFNPIILDELRYKYSKFRTRHTDEYMQKQFDKMRLEELKKQSVSLMDSPADIVARAKRREDSHQFDKERMAQRLKKSALPATVLENVKPGVLHDAFKKQEKEEILAKLGEHMMRNLKLKLPKQPEKEEAGS